MPSKTSFFNPTVLKKDITRYCPLWSLYTIAAFLVILLLEPTETVDFARNVLGIFQMMPVINLCYAGITVLLLFGDLYQSRMCNALHAMPLRREGWFFTHAAAGALFSLVPNLLCALTVWAFLGPYGSLAWHWFWIVTVQFLFFYGTALLCALCAGNRFSMAALYAIFHFIVLLVLAMAATIYQPLLPGILLDSEEYLRFCPTFSLVESEFILMDFYHVGNSIYATDPELNAQALTKLLWLGLVGIVSAVGALLLYRRRHLERAGDFLSVKCLTPVFLVICSLGAGIFCYGISELFYSLSWLFVAVGLAVGFFGAKMLLSRTVKVFTGKAFLGFGCIAALLVGSILVTAADPLGITRYVPRQEQVVSVQIVHNRSGGFYGHNTITVKDPDTVAKALQAHAQLIGAQDQEEYFSGISFRYTLEDGRTVTRGYNVPHDSVAAQLLQELYTSWEYLFDGIPKEKLADKLNLVEGEFYNKEGAYHTGFTVPGERYGELVEALWQDQQAGQLSPRFRFGKNEDDAYVGYLCLYVPGQDSIYLDIHSFAKHTVAFLDSIAETSAES